MSTLRICHCLFLPSCAFEIGVICFSFMYKWLQETRVSFLTCSGFSRSTLGLNVSQFFSCISLYMKLCRYKIYAEGYAWSVSLKYILSCGSLPLIITPEYEDFFTRGLIPKKNFLPVPKTGICPAIKSFVDWGNKHSSQVCHHYFFPYNASPFFLANIIDCNFQPKTYVKLISQVGTNSQLG